MYESGAHAASVGAEPIPILNSRAGRLSSYALSVMVLWLFNNDEETVAYHQSLISGGAEGEGVRRWGQDQPLDHPIFVLLRFLQVGRRVARVGLALPSLPSQLLLLAPTPPTPLKPTTGLLRVRLGDTGSFNRGDGRDAGAWLA